MMYKERTTKQVLANKLDQDIYSLSDRLFSGGYKKAAESVYSARFDVRKDMHPKDKEETIGWFND
jgi:hypothetical protein